MVIGIIIGILIICVGICVQKGILNKFFEKNIASIEGDIVDYKEINGYRSRNFHAIVEYTVNGVKYRHVCSYGSSRKLLKTTMRIKYNIHNPTESYDGDEFVGKNIIILGLIIIFFVCMYSLK